MDWIKVKKNRHYYRRRIELILNSIDLSGKTVLDLGCGEMIIRKLLGDQLDAYTGIDEISFQQDPNFICGNIFDVVFSLEKNYDVIIALGVLDHLSPKDQDRLIRLCLDKSQESVVISHCHHNSLFLKWLGIKCRGINLLENCNVHDVQLKYGLKVPLTQWFLNLSLLPSYFRNFATEKIWIMSKIDLIK